MNNLARTLYVSLGNLVEPLLERISSLEALEYLFYRYGWDVELDDAMFTKISQSLRLRLPLEEFLSAIEHVQPQLAETTHSDHSGENLVSLAASADALVRALAELTPSSLTEFVPP